MIKVEVLNSSSPDEIGTYPFSFDSIQVGATFNNDLILSHSQNRDEKVQIIIDGDFLYLETKAINQFIILNKKKVSGRLRLKPNDVITFGDCEIKILQFIKNKSIDDFPYENYEKILLNDGPQKNLIIAIEDELKKLS